MKTSRCAQIQIIGVLKRVDAGVKVEDACRGQEKAYLQARNRLIEPPTVFNRLNSTSGIL